MESTRERSRGQAEEYCSCKGAKPPEEIRSRLGNNHARRLAVIDSRGNARCAACGRKTHNKHDNPHSPKFFRADEILQRKQREADAMDELRRVQAEIDGYQLCPPHLHHDFCPVRCSGHRCGNTAKKCLADPTWTTGAGQ